MTGDTRPHLPPLFRWIPAAFVSLMLFAALLHRSHDPSLLGRYSGEYAQVLGGMTLLAGVLWWLAFSPHRLGRVVDRGMSPTFVCLCLLVPCILFFLDPFANLNPIVRSLPYLGAGLLIGLSLGKRQKLLPPADDGSRSSESGSRLSPLVLATLSTVVTLTACEVVFRLFFLGPVLPQTPADFEETIASKWPEMICAEKKEGVFRILGLSDSFGVAGGHENYHYLLETRLRERGVAVEVVNVSLAEMQPVDELALLQRFGPLYLPDLVLHGIYVGNDLSPTEGHLLEFRGISVRQRLGMEGLRPRGSYLLQWTRRRMLIARSQRQKRAEMVTNGQEQEGTFSVRDFLAIETRWVNACLEGVDPKPVLELLEKIRRITADMGARYLMVIHPQQTQVEDLLRRRVLEGANLTEEAVDLEHFQQELKVYCDSLEISCLDLLPDFRQMGAAGGLYLPRDTHYSVEGNQVAAETIRAFLEEQHLVPD